MIIVSEGTFGNKQKTTGSFTTTIPQTGDLSIRYEFTYAGVKAIVREIGVALDVARTCDTLTWERRAPWTDYPADHIGRAKGIAPAFRDPAGKDDNPPQITRKVEWWEGPTVRDNPKIEPTWSWSLNQTSTGTTDFCSTKYDVINASLRSQDGAALWVSGMGTQAVRAAVTGNVIRLFVNDFSGAGFAQFLSLRKTKNQNRDIEPAGKVKGTATLRLVNDKP